MTIGPWLFAFSSTISIAHARTFTFPISTHTMLTMLTQRTHHAHTHTHAPSPVRLLIYLCHSLLFSRSLARFSIIGSIVRPDSGLPLWSPEPCDCSLLISRAYGPLLPPYEYHYHTTYAYFEVLVRPGVVCFFASLSFFLLCFTYRLLTQARSRTVIRSYGHTVPYIAHVV
ncbi:hypothetical protein C8Q70DRAFT_600782 [Cubamyces menziesii]|nr:hypothetical protein C8Q70DRAFT_600782 [Cubamyces menziesii]